MKALKAFTSRLIIELAGVAIATALLKQAFGEGWLMTFALVAFLTGAFRPLEEAIRAGWKTYKEQSDD